MTQHLGSVCGNRISMIYFIRDEARDAIKVGYSGDPWKRLVNLQVGNPSRLNLIGIVAAPPDVENVIYNCFLEGHIAGEWYFDRGILSKWLTDITHGEPMLRNVWDFVPGRYRLVQDGSWTRVAWEPVE